MVTRLEADEDGRADVSRKIVFMFDTLQLVDVPQIRLLSGNVRRSLRKAVESGARLDKLKRIGHLALLRKLSPHRTVGKLSRVNVHIVIARVL